MPPGKTKRPDAYTTVCPIGSIWVRTSRIVLSSISTSACSTRSAVTTVPFFIRIPILAPKLIARVSSQNASGIRTHYLLRSGWHQSLGGTLLPAFERQAIIDALHRDAILNRANQRAEIAAYTMVL